MSDSEFKQLLLQTLTKLDDKLDEISKEVAGLSTEIALLKRDKAWTKYLAGVVGGGISLALSMLLKP
jgi:hypothetical protein